MTQERISNIEKKVTELKFHERDLLKERESVRLKSLSMAEKCDAVEDIINDFFVKHLRASRRDIDVSAVPSKYTGRDDEEHLSEVKVNISLDRPEEGLSYRSISVQLFLVTGFIDTDVASREKKITDEIEKLRSEIEKLKEEKKLIKSRV